MIMATLVHVASSLPQVISEVEEPQLWERIYGLLHLRNFSIYFQLRPIYLFLLAQSG